jgi:methylthioribose-1-phosphate isomerase
MDAPTKPSSNTKEIDELEKVVKAYEQLAASFDPIIAATNAYAAAQVTVNAALAAGAISQAQANVTLEMAKQKLDQATGAAVDLSSVFSTMESSMESAFMSMVDGTMTAKDAFRSMAKRCYQRTLPRSGCSANGWVV